MMGKAYLRLVFAGLRWSFLCFSSRCFSSTLYYRAVIFAALCVSFRPWHVILEAVCAVAHRVFAPSLIFLMASTSRNSSAEGPTCTGSSGIQPDIWEAFGLIADSDHLKHNGFGMRGRAFHPICRTLRHEV